MKPLSYAAALLGIALASSAYAQTTINIAGSSATRLSTQTAISKLLTTPKFAGGNADPTKASFGIWTGKYKGAAVKIKVVYAGSAGGIAAVAGSQTVKFPADATPTADPNVAGNKSDAKVPNFALSDIFQSTTVFNGTYQGKVYAKLTDVPVGVIGFKWVGSKGYPGSNLTTQQAQTLFKSGKAPLALFSGSSADKNKTVFALGRNPDSGTRGVSLSEIGLGYAAVVKQYQPTITGAVANAAGQLVGGTVASQALWPIEVVSGISTKTLGNSGFSSGGTLALALTAKLGSAAYKVGNSKATAGYYISGVGYSDSIVAITNGAKELAWNGVKYSDVAIQQGQYTFWGYSHLFYQSNLSGVARTFADAVATQIKTVDATASGAGLFISGLAVKRSTDGGLVAPTYF